MFNKLIKTLVFILVGILSFPGLALFNRLKIRGMENLNALPEQNVLFVSNHQTYFADVIAFLHIFCAHKWRKKNKLGLPYYLLNPFTNIFFVAAEETMKSSFISRLFTLAGAITVKRTWNDGGKDIRRGLDPSDTRKVFDALENNWVITFPQGTTKPFAPGRKGTAFIIKHSNPIVVPVVIKGFSKAFDKKGLKLQKKGSLLSVEFKTPITFNKELQPEEIMEIIMDSIEQSKKYMPILN